jgi:hypothetical protein
MNLMPASKMAKIVVSATSRRCLQAVLQFRDFVVLITHFGCQIVEMS